MEAALAAGAQAEVGKFMKHKDFIHKLDDAQVVRSHCGGRAKDLR